MHVVTPTIFVSVASYSDHELPETIDDALARAEHPEALRFGICHQYDVGGDDVTGPRALAHHDADPRFRIIRCDRRASLGGPWARHLISTRLYDGEHFTLQIDAHTRFAPGWDARLTAMMASLPSERPLITGFPPRYHHDPESGRLVLGDASVVPTTVVLRWDREGWIHHVEQPIAANTAVPRRTRVLSGAFVFTLGRWNVDVPQDPDQLYTEEEFAHTLRSFTAGYDLFNPTEVVLWHRDRADNPKYIYDRPDRLVRARRARALARHCVLLAGDPFGDLAPYGLGTERTLADYYEFSGLDCVTQTIHPDARDGVPPSPRTISWTTPRPRDEPADVGLHRPGVAAAWAAGDAVDAHTRASVEAAFAELAVTPAIVLGHDDPLRARLLGLLPLARREVGLPWSATGDIELRAPSPDEVSFQRALEPPIDAQLGFVIHAGASNGAAAGAEPSQRWTSGWLRITDRSAGNVPTGRIPPATMHPPLADSIVCFRPDASVELQPTVHALDAVPPECRRLVGWVRTREPAERVPSPAHVVHDGALGDDERAALALDATAALRDRDAGTVELRVGIDDLDRTPWRSAVLPDTSPLLALVRSLVADSRRALGMGWFARGVRGAPGGGARSGHDQRAPHGSCPRRVGPLAAPVLRLRRRPRSGCRCTAARRRARASRLRHRSGAVTGGDRTATRPPGGVPREHRVPPARRRWGRCRRCARERTRVDHDRRLGSRGRRRARTRRPCARTMRPSPPGPLRAVPPHCPSSPWSAPTISRTACGSATCSSTPGRRSASRASWCTWLPARRPSRSRLERTGGRCAPGRATAIRTPAIGTCSPTARRR